MLTEFKVDSGFVYVNPERVFCVVKRNDENTVIWSGDENNSVIVNEPLDQVAMRLNDAMRR